MGRQHSSFCIIANESRIAFSQLNFSSSGLYFILPSFPPSFPPSLPPSFSHLQELPDQLVEEAGDGARIRAGHVMFLAQRLEHGTCLFGVKRRQLDAQLRLFDRREREKVKVSEWVFVAPCLERYLEAAA